MKFFVSYSRSVQDKVREIIASLRDSGDDVWWDQDLRAGQDWWGTILNNIEACDVCLFMISEKSVQSPYCMEELRYALDRNRLVLPYVMDAPLSYTIPPEILQGRIQYEIYSGTPSQLKYRIRTTCQSVDWAQYRNRYAARPVEPNTEANDLVERLDKAAALANEGHFDEAVKRFNDVSRNDPESYGDFCHTWIDKIKRYQDVVKHASSPALKSLARQKWDGFAQQFTGDDFFDPLNLQAKLAATEAPKKRTGLLALVAAKEMTADDYFTRAQDAYSKGAHDQVIADCSETIRLDPQHSPAYFRRGVSYAAKSEHDLAIADYTQAVQLNPQYAAAYNGRGSSYANQNEYDLAIADFKEAALLSPQYTAAYFNLGLSYAAKDEHDLAIAHYSEAAHLDPMDADTYFRRGNSYYLTRNFDQAIKDYEIALRINPNYDLARNNLQVALQAKTQAQS